MKMIVTLINSSGKVLYRDITDLTQEELDQYVWQMDVLLRERLHREVAPCSPGMFLKAWADEVGPEEAGRVIVGAEQE